MAYERILVTVSYKADIDLRTYQYHLVIRTATGVALPGSGAAIPLGILQNAPNIGEEAVVAPLGCGGISKAVCGGTAPGIGVIVSCEYIGASDAGKVIAAANPSYPCGLVVEAGSAEDDLCSILLAPIHRAIAEDL
jgi:hypothetical protein